MLKAITVLLKAYKNILIKKFTSSIHKIGDILKITNDKTLFLQRILNIDLINKHYKSIDIMKEVV